jgi:predicted DNA-binding transcriptional regulator AlpA
MLIPFDDLRTYGIALTRPAIRTLAKQGRFPKPVRIGQHHVAWHENEILEWIANLPRAEDAPLPRTKSRKTISLRPVSKSRKSVVDKVRLKAKLHKALAA